jgi:phosphoribosylformylglycinamidine synthase
VDPGETVPLYRALAEAHRAGLVRSAGTPALGGLAVAGARAVVAADLGLDLDLADPADLASLPGDAALFSESAGRVVVTVRAADAARLEALGAGLACRRLGVVTAAPRLVVRRGSRRLVDLDRAALGGAMRGAFADA